MKYVTINDPLKPIEPAGFKSLIVPLNIAESILRAAIGHQVEILDLSNTFDSGLKAEFKAGQLIGWKAIAVF